MKKAFFLFGTLFVCGSVWAESCKNLDIFVVNKTHSICRVKKLAYSGELLKWNLKGIPINSRVNVAELEQRVFSNPDITLTIVCGENEKIVLYSKQNYCLFSGGSVMGRIDYKNILNAEHVAKEGSFRDSKNGIITWTLLD